MPSASHNEGLSSVAGLSICVQNCLVSYIPCLSTQHIKPMPPRFPVMNLSLSFKNLGLYISWYMRSVRLYMGDLNLVVLVGVV